MNAIQALSQLSYSPTRETCLPEFEGIVNNIAMAFVIFFGGRPALGDNSQKGSFGAGGLMRAHSRRTDLVNLRSPFKDIQQVPSLEKNCASCRTAISRAEGRAQAGPVFPGPGQDRLEGLAGAPGIREPAGQPQQFIH